MVDRPGSRITDEFLQSFYSTKRVFITGGLGFSGSNVANRPSAMGAQVVMLDSLHPLYGGNRFNLDPALAERMRVVIGNVRNWHLVEELVADVDTTFHLPAQVSYLEGGNEPLEDPEPNRTAPPGLLETFRHSNVLSRLSTAPPLPGVIAKKRGAISSVTCGRFVFAKRCSLQWRAIVPQRRKLGY